MNDATSDSDELLRLSRGGDAAALARLIDRHRDRLTRMVQVRMDPRLKSRIDASDVVQEVLAKAMQKMPRYLTSQSIAFYPWLRQLALEEVVHQLDRHLKYQKRSVLREGRPQLKLTDESSLLLAEQFVAEGTSPSVHAMRDELVARVQLAMEQLPAESQELFMLRYVEQMPAREIGEVLGISEAAVNMRHLRAIEKLRSVLALRQREI